MTRRPPNALLAAMLLVAGGALAGCEVERAGGERDEAAGTGAEVDASGMDEREVAGEEGGTTVVVDGERIEEGAERAGERVEEGARRAGESLEQGARQVGEALDRGARELGRRAGPVLDDAAITAKVKARLTADPEVNPLHVDVDTIEGRVTLNGIVATRAQRDEAEKLARGTEGVVEVVNLLRVRGEVAPVDGPAPGGPPPPSR